MTDILASITSFFAYIYYTVPYMMLWQGGGGGANRLNIVGVAWVPLMSLVAYHHSFRILSKSLMAKLITSFMVIWFVHLTFDEVSWWLYVASAVAGAKWFHVIPTRWPMYASISAIVLAFYFNWQTFKPFFKFKKTFGIMIIILSFWCAGGVLLSVGDFAQFEGWERLWRFWLFYPPTYALLSLFIISFLRGKKNG